MADEAAVAAGGSDRLPCSQASHSGLCTSMYALSHPNSHQVAAHVGPRHFVAVHLLQALGEVQHCLAHLYTVCVCVGGGGGGMVDTVSLGFGERRRAQLATAMRMRDCAATVLLERLC